MRLLYLDIDSLRPDHLGCYGYHRQTSPHIDAIAARGVRYNNCYATDVPCLPSRTALFCGRPGILNGVTNHGGVAADPFLEGANRAFKSRLTHSAWPAVLRQNGFSKTAMISPFGERHSAWHIYAGFTEIHNSGGSGMDRADEVEPIALEWLDKNAADDDWFLHLNLWDPHTPYRVPDSFGNPFADEPLPAWLTEEIRQKHWSGCGPHSAREVLGYGDRPYESKIGLTHPRQPSEIDSMDKVRQMFDGYDCGVAYADQTVGRLMNALEQAGVLDETAVIISSDHGENLGELNIYGDHQTADYITGRVPLIMSWPGVTEAQAGSERSALVQNIDIPPTTIELLGGEAPGIWQGESFASTLNGDDEAREQAIVSQGAWSLQRAVRWDDGAHAWMCIRSYHEGHHGFPDVMLFDVKADPHEQFNLADERPAIAGEGLRRLDKWIGEMMAQSETGVDPFWTAMSEGGPLHTRGALPDYLVRLRATERGEWADWLEKRYQSEV